MLESLLDLPALLGCLAVMGIAVVLGLSVYGVAQRALFEDRQDELGDATRTIFLAVNLVFGLFLSLSLNDVLDELKAIDYAVEREAIAIADVFNGLGYFEPGGGGSAQEKLIEYTTAIIEDDWPSLARDRLGQRPGALPRELASLAMTLDVDDRARQAAWDRLIADMDVMSDYRLARLDHALTHPPFFLVVVLFGFVVVMTCIGLYRPTRTLIVLVSLYASFIGLVIYLILALSDPFQGIPGVDVAPLEIVLHDMQAARLSLD